MSDPRWSAIETYIQDYLITNFLQDSIKRDDEFETIWYAAHGEGGKYHLQRFFIELENEAKNAQ